MSPVSWFPVPIFLWCPVSLAPVVIVCWVAFWFFIGVGGVVLMERNFTHTFNGILRDSIRVGVDAIAGVVGFITPFPDILGLFDGFVDGSLNSLKNSLGDFVVDDSLNGVEDDFLLFSVDSLFTVLEDGLLALFNDLLGLVFIDDIFFEIKNCPVVDILDSPWLLSVDSLWFVDIDGVLVGLGDFSWHFLGNCVIDCLFLFLISILWLEESLSDIVGFLVVVMWL